MKKNYYDKLSQKEKDEIIKNANDLIDVFSDLFGVKPEHFKSGDVFYYDLDIDKNKNKNKNNDKSYKSAENNTENKSDNMKNNKEEKTENNSPLSVDYSDLLYVLSSLFKEKTDDKEKTDNSEKTDDKEKTDNDVQTEKKQNTVKERLVKEAEFDKEKYSEELKDMIIKRISDILEDEKEHKYKIHKKTLTTPPAVEINLKEMPSYLKDNIYILKDLETIIKNQYDFENVYINFENSENKKFINLNFYMILE